MGKKIAFYFEKIEGLSHTDDLDDLTDLHTRSFEKYGWEVVHLNESNARQHPLYPVFDDPTSVFASSRNGWEYTRACYMRWLAYASAGHFFADFDVINYGFSHDDALDMRRLAGGATFLSGATAVGLFQQAEYDQILGAFIDYQKNPFVEGSLVDDVNDMTILLQCRPNLFAITGTEDVRVARDYSCPGWEEAQLVHYPYHYVKPPRSKTVREKRNPLLDDEGPPPEVWPAYLSRAGVLNAILTLFETPHYLEIGANSGDTFFAAQAQRKVAVSPSFSFDVEEAKAKHPNCLFYSAKSDAFFGNPAVEQSRYDVIFLSGLHTLEQTIRDLFNAVAFLTSDGIIVIDNVIPSSYHAALPDEEIAWHVRNQLGVQDGMWMGDVYKIVFFLQTFLQQYSYATVVENHGQLVVWKSRRPAEEIVQRRVEDIGRTSYESVLLRSDDFNRVPFSEIMRRLRGR